MKIKFFVVPALALLFLFFGQARFGYAQSIDTGYYYEPAGPALLTTEELDDLLAPIALYPDPLIAQILPAATFVDQIDQAARFVRQYGNTSRIDAQPWDISVRAIAHYPDVLFMMDRKYEWTAALGQAYIQQPQDVMDAVQRLRADARAEGNLYSTAQQQVVVEPDYIRIVPASPQYVYVPVYDPDVVYVQSYDPFVPFITFSSGFLIGAWLSRDCDWRRHRVYYHGWRGGGWVGRARPHIHDRRGIYTGRRASAIRVNDRVLQHDTHRFREQLRTAPPIRRREGPVMRHPQGGPLPRTGERQRRPGIDRRTPAAGGQPGTTVERRRTPEGGRQQQMTPGTVPPTGRERSSAAPAATSRPAPVTGVTPPATAGEARQPVSRGRPVRPTTRDVFRGRDVQGAQPASQSGYGGYGTGRDATIYRQRGESSREMMRQPRTTTTPRVVTPTPQPGVSPSRPAPRMMERPTVAPSAPRAAPFSPRAVAPVTPRSAAPMSPRSVAPSMRAPASRPASPAGGTMQRR